jgi:hypothetical protein
MHIRNSLSQNGPSRKGPSSRQPKLKTDQVHSSSRHKTAQAQNNPRHTMDQNGPRHKTAQGTKWPTVLNLYIYIFVMFVAYFEPGGQFVMSCFVPWGVLYYNRLSWYLSRQSGKSTVKTCQKYGSLKRGEWKIREKTLHSTLVGWLCRHIIIDQKCGY